MKWLTRAASVLLLSACVNAQALANSLIPSDRWVASISVAKPLVPYKLGLISLTAGSGVATELPTAARAVLKQAGYFDNAGTERMHVDVAVLALSAGSSEVEYTARRGTATRSAGVIYKKVIKAHTQNQSMSSEVTDERVLAGNVKLFAIDFRKHFDPGFSQQAKELIAVVNEDTDSRGILSHVGEAAMTTMVATVEGTAAVASTMGEVIASEEFQQGVLQVANDVAQQQQQLNAERARMTQLQVAAAREREAKLEAQRVAAQQRQAERNKQLADNARWEEAKQQDAALFRKAKADEAAQRTAEQARQRAENERVQRQTRAEAQQKAAADAEQARQRITTQQRANQPSGAIIVESRPPAPQWSPPPAPKPVAQTSNEPSQEWFWYRDFPTKPKNLNCQKEQQCRSACPRQDPAVGAACSRACTARSTCKVSLQ